MQLILLLVVFVFLANVLAFRHRRHYRIKKQNKVGYKQSIVYPLYFNQTLDHFSDDSSKIFSQLYYLDTTYYQGEDCPVFLMINGEAEALTIDLREPWALWARSHCAALVSLEHRYYGSSIPEDDLSTENMKYLSSEQALADAANFIQFANENWFGNNTKWITFGGSYAGNLAAWMRLKYPDLVHAAVSSSGPVKAELDFKEYLEVVGDSLAAAGSEECKEATMDGFSKIDQLLKNKNGRRRLDRIFSTCDKLENHVKDANNRASFFDALLTIYADTVQYNNQQYPTVKDVCNIMTNKSRGTTVRRVADVQKFDGYGTKYCLSYLYKELVDQFSDTDARDDARQWIYQTCTEFGYFQSTSGKNVFGNTVPVEYYIDQCTDIFGKSFNREEIQNGIDNTNSVYGGLDIDVSRIVYVHGSIDPWHALGITETRYDSSPAIYINGTSHCQDMNEPSHRDPPQLSAARKDIAELIEKWLNEQ